MKDKEIMNLKEQEKKEGRDNVVIIRIRWKPEEVCSLVAHIDELQ